MVNEQPPDLSALDGAFESIDDETDLDKIFARFLDPKNIHHVTELNKQQIVAVTTLSNIAREYDIDFLKEWLADYLKYQVSAGRQGRKEWVKITSRAGENEEKQRGFGFGNFFRRD